MGADLKVRQERSEVSTAPPSATIASSDLRTIAVVGHRSAGKTSLCELLLKAGRVVRETGTVEDGTTLLDWAPIERRHQQTLELSAAWLEHGGVVLQLLDTPGAPFLAEVRDMGLAAADAALLVLDSTEGLKGRGLPVGVEEALRSAARLEMPVIAVQTKVDRQPHGALEEGETLDALTAAAGIRAVRLQLPFHEEGEHGERQVVGLVDLLEERVLRFSREGTGEFSPEPVPESLRAEVDRARELLTEAVATTDDQLLEQYLEYFTLPADELRRALVEAVRQRSLLPVLVASSEARIGAFALLDALKELVPPYGVLERRLIEQDGSERPLQTGLDGAGAPFVAQVLSEHRDDRGDTWHLLRILAGKPPRGDWIDGRYGTGHKIRKLYRVRGPRRAAAPPPVPGLLVATWDPLELEAGTTLTDGQACEVALPPTRPPMFAMWVRPAHPKDQYRVDQALRAVVRGDRGLALLSDTSSGALLLAGAEEAHVRIALERLQAWSGVQIVAELPPVGYVETPTATVQGVEGVHVQKDGDGLVEEYGKCELALQPSSPEEETRFFDDGVDEEDLPVRYRGAIDQGARLAMRHGPTAGYPVVGVDLHLTGGAYDILQSTDDHFRLAGEKAVRIALEKVGTRVLEPWWQVEIAVPQSAVGDLISDVTSHRGRILGVEVAGEVAYITAHTPYRELRTFGGRVQTLTAGRGRFQTAMSHYEPLPDHLLREAIEASPYRAVTAHRGR
jgi:elongation factor G